MSNYNRKGLAHSRKVMTTSVGSTKPRYSMEAALLQSSVKDNRLNLSENVYASSMFIVPDKSSEHHLRQLNDNYLGNWQDVREVKQTPLNFASVSKPSAAVDRLIAKRRRNHEDAMKNVRDELAICYAACENEFKNRSDSLKIQINQFRKEIEEVRDKLREINPSDLQSEDCDMAWKKVRALINDEKQLVDRFYNHLLNIEKKRLEYAKPILQKYYKIFHKISFLLPYEIQVYLETEILNYNEAVLGNHRFYADLRLQMHLLADATNIGFKYWIEELKIDTRETMGKVLQ